MVFYSSFKTVSSILMSLLTYWKAFWFVSGTEHVSEDERSALPTTSHSRPAGSRPTRAIARTQHSERVRANVNRHRITQARTAAQVCMMLLSGSSNILVLKFKRRTVGCCQFPQKHHILNTVALCFLIQINVVGTLLSEDQNVPEPTHHMWHLI